MYLVATFTVYLVAKLSVYSADLQTIFCRIARNAGGAIAGYAPFAPRFGLQNGVVLKALCNFVRYGGKEAQSGVIIDFFAEFHLTL